MRLVPGLFDQMKKQRCLKSAFCHKSLLANPLNGTFDTASTMMISFCYLLQQY